MFIIEPQRKLVIHTASNMDRKYITEAGDDRVADDVGPSSHRCSAKVRLALGGGRIPYELMSGPEWSGIVDTIDLYGTPILWCLTGLQCDHMVRSEQVGILQCDIQSKKRCRRHPTIVQLSFAVNWR